MLLVVAWDGACFEVVDDFVAAGDMPALAALLERGRAWRVRSTVPPVTFPAWTSFMTGTGPARHGITDFAVRDPGAYRVRFVNSTYRRQPTIWSLLAAAGKRVGVYAMPATYPAEKSCALQVCGFDTPLGASGAEGFCHPRTLGDQLMKRYGSLAIEGVPQGRIEEGWHRQAASRLLATIALRTTIVCDLLSEQSFDVFAVHYMESDTVAHHFWQFDDDASPRTRRGPRSTIREVYRALDRALARLVAVAGDDADVVLVSDHGSGGCSDRAIFWNRWLADGGWLRFTSGGGGAGARALRRAALKLVPAPLQARLFGRFAGAASRLESRARFAGIDWVNTSAFSDELPYYPSLWLNLKGREPGGIIERGDVDSVLRDLAAAAMEFRDPFDGGRVVSAVRRREELFDGPFAALAPDLIFELRQPDGYSYCAGSSLGGAEASAMRRLSAYEMRGAKGGSTSGSHRDFGLMVVAGTRVGSSDAVTAEPLRACCTMADAGVTALALGGVAATPAMEGCSVVDCEVRSALAAGGQTFVSESGDEVSAMPEPSDPTLARAEQSIDYYGSPHAYDAAEEAEVIERLRSLGYLP